MKIIKSKETNVNKNILLYKCLTEGDEEIGKVRMIFFENDKHSWNVWEIVVCNNLNDYLEFKNNQTIKEKLKSDIKAYINYQKEDKVNIVVYPVSDDNEVINAMIIDLMQQYSILTINKKTKVIEIFDL